MASITYQVTLSSDGRPLVSVTSDDPTAARDAIPWLAQTYAALLKDAKAVPTPASTLIKQQEAEVPPTCAVHQLPMVRVQGRKGPFWSCHQKLPDGSWCTSRE
jgi:hypothetical protein